MNATSNTNATPGAHGALDEIVRRYGVALTPREALLALAGVRDGGRMGKGNAPCRDAAKLRRLGIEPVKVLGRWVVPAAEVAAWARGERTPMRAPRIDRRRREYRAASAAASAVAQGGAA